MTEVSTLALQQLLDGEFQFSLTGRAKLAPTGTRLLLAEHAPAVYAHSPHDYTADQEEDERLHSPSLDGYGSGDIRLQVGRATVGQTGHEVHQVGRARLLRGKRSPAS